MEKTIKSPLITCPLRATVLFISVFALLFALTGCSDRDVFGYEKQYIREKLAHGERGFLRHIDYSKYDVDQALEIGSAAPYYIARHLESLDLVSTSAALRLLAWKTGDFPVQAALELLDSYLQEEEFDRAESSAERFLEELDQDRLVLYSREEAEALITYKLIQALYEQKKDKQLLKWSRSLDPEKLEEEERFEAQLMEQVASYRLGEPGAPGELYRFALRAPLGELQGRIYLFLTYHDPDLQDFTEDQRDLLKGLYLAGGRQYGQAYDLLHPLALEVPELFQERRLLLSLYRVYLGSSAHEEGAQVLGRWAKESDRQFRFELNERTGRLYRAAGNYPRALDYLEQAVRLAPAGSIEHERALWYWASTLYRTGAVRLADHMDQLVSRWQDPEYFDDLIDPMIADLVGRGDWRRLDEVYRLLAPSAEPDTIQRLSYILRHSGRPGYRRGPLPAGEAAVLPGEASAGPKGDSPLSAGRTEPPGPPWSPPGEEPEDWRVSTAGFYYAFLGGADGSVLLPPAPAGEQTPQTEEFRPAMNRYVRGMLDYGHLWEAYRLGSRSSGELSPELLLRLTEELAEQDALRPSIRIAEAALRSGRWTGGEQRLSLVYPQGYARLVKEAAAEAGLPAGLLFAVVREESRFDEEIVSYAGAVGLSQLMPDTASDMAARLGLPEPEHSDLIDPKTNLRIGAYYLAGLIDRFDSIPRALAAYNGGPTRMRRWERLYADLPEDLLVEAIPIEQTRNYVKKVVVSFIAYEYLYRQRSPVETLAVVYPDFTAAKRGGEN